MLEIASGKKLSDSDLIGDAGIALIHGRVAAMRHAWRALNLDAGIDGSIELRDPATGVVSNKHLLVQSKASNNPFPGETAERFHYICDERDLEYWLKSDIPVLLICSHPELDQAWWVHVQGYFADPARRADRRVDFTKSTMQFGGSLTERLFAIADPTGRAFTPRPSPHPERLESNLCEVVAPPMAFSYSTKAGSRKDVYSAQSKSGLAVHDDFVISGQRLITWSTVDGSALGNAVVGEGQQIATLDLAGGDADQNRLLVQLLNNTLRQDLRAMCDYSGDRNVLYVRATDDRGPLKWHTGGHNSRAIFKGYQSKKDPTKVSYFRHAALSWQFLVLESEIYCAISPGYFFSRDGVRESFYAAEQLAKIKRIDRHAAVRQETRMWSSILRNEANLLSDERATLLEFGPLVSFPVPSGIDDLSWKSNETADSSSSDSVPLFELPK